MQLDFTNVDLPAANDEIDQWWSKFHIQLVGFTVASLAGPASVTHWLAVARNHAGRVELYRLCGTLNNDLPWARMPGANVTCMTCLVRAARERWREPD